MNALNPEHISSSESYETETPFLDKFKELLPGVIGLELDALARYVN